MKTTNHIRKIDSLGRIVIPKDIREICHISDAENFYVSSNKDGEIILTPLAPTAGELEKGSFFIHNGITHLKISDVSIYCNAFNFGTKSTVLIPEATRVKIVNVNEIGGKK